MIDSAGADLHLPIVVLQNSIGSKERNLGFEYKSLTLPSSICNI